MTFEVREDLLQIACEQELIHSKRRGSKWWKHAGPPFAHELIAWWIAQYRGHQRRTKKAASNKREKIAALKEAGLG